MEEVEAAMSSKSNHPFHFQILPSFFFSPTRESKRTKKSGLERETCSIAIIIVSISIIIFISFLPSHLLPFPVLHLASRRKFHLFFESVLCPFYLNYGLGLVKLLGDPTGSLEFRGKVSFESNKREGLSRKYYHMDSFNQGTGFRYNLNSNNSDDANEDSDFSGILEIFVHHARNIHNICIYDNQDVYAKFSLTYNPDETLSTSIVNGGGKNPEFNENLRMTITQLDANLKCEIWMLSRARNFMEDQLLGFALVPISKIAGKGKVTENYNLSSTDLTHSPAGTIQLSISLNTSLPVIPSKSISESSGISSISSEVVLLDRKISEVFLDPVEYSRIEFPDLSVVRENQKMVSQYFNLAEPGLASFLHLGAFYEPIDDYDMAANSSEELQIGSISTNGSLNSGIFSSNTTGLSDDRNSAESIEKKNLAEIPNSINTSISTGADYRGLDSATSKKGREAIDEKEGSSKFSSKEEEMNKGENPGPVSFSQVFSAPLGNINLEVEQSAMQQQIVDMYMRSMQEFTESLAKMKLPMDLDKPEHENSCVLVQNQREKPKNDKKNDGNRVFYGSRAFF